MSKSSIIFQYFPELSDVQQHQFNELQALYEDWNEKINVISRKDIDDLYERHVLHSLSIAKYITFNAQSHILDMGTGGGFPGIPLAILFPEVQFHLVDSIGKKIKVVKAVAEELNLKNVTAEHQRAEKIKGRYDFIISRAVAQIKLLEIWSKNKIKNSHSHQLKNGIICLKGGELQTEISATHKMVSTINISDFYKEAYFKTKKIVHIFS